MRASRTTAEAFPFAQWPDAKSLAYSCAAARDLHPLPSSAPVAERANFELISWKEQPKEIFLREKL